MTDTFVKLYGAILDSSVWGEPLAVRVVWIAMLTMADKYGVVAASSDGISRRANVPLKATEKALAVLEAPDPRSKSQEFEGRRIERFDGGWRILNYERYRDKRSDKQVKDAERQQRHRDRGVTERDVTPSHSGSQKVALEADADTDTEETTNTPLPRESFVERLLARVPERQAWRAEIDGMLGGMAGHWPVTPEQMESAAKDYLANGKGKQPNLRQFRRYVEGIITEKRNGAKPSGKGSTTRAMKLIALVRDRRDPLHPNSVVATWREGLSNSDIEVCKTFGLVRLLNDTNEGTVVAQLARALEESAHG